MKTIQIGLILLLGIVINGCARNEITSENVPIIYRSASRAFPIDTVESNYVIREGDQVRLSIWGYPEFDTTTVVKETGAIGIALIGEIRATGYTKEQFTQQLKAKLSDYIKGEIKLTLTVTTTLSRKITVIGSVARQDNYPVIGNVSLVEILSTAGGAVAESDLHHIKIIRYGETQHPVEVDLALYLENGNIESIPIVRPGDTVFVPKKENVVREFSDFFRDALFLFGFFRVFN
jgi:protein involved in polysaccharide export with SLBB domain